MRRRTAVALAAAGTAVAVAIAAVVLVPTDDTATTAAVVAAPQTAEVVRGRLSASITQGGELTYAAREDGTPYAVFNHARGVFTGLPETGHRVDCGAALYRVDDRPVLLLCGALATYRELRIGMRGRDVRQLNRNLHRLGADAWAGGAVDPASARFDWSTQRALEEFQRRRGLQATGVLGVDQAVVLPGAVRVAAVAVQPGGPARPGTRVLSASSDDLRVRVELTPGQRAAVRPGSRARITLPGRRAATGRVARVGRVAAAPAGKGQDEAAVSIAAWITFDRAEDARGLDAAPVRVEITTGGVRDALSVPVTALVGRAGGGFAVEVVRPGGRQEQVGVKLGLFDATGGRVQVDGALRAGDDVVVPSL